VKTKGNLLTRFLCDVLSEVDFEVSGTPDVYTKADRVALVKTQVRNRAWFVYMKFGYAFVGQDEVLHRFQRLQDGGPDVWMSFGICGTTDEPCRVGGFACIISDPKCEKELSRLRAGLLELEKATRNKDAFFSLLLDLGKDQIRVGGYGGGMMYYVQRFFCAEAMKNQKIMRETVEEAISLDLFDSDLKRMFAALLASRGL
jgi:hypothetical protein